MLLELLLNQSEIFFFTSQEYRNNLKKNAIAVNDDFNK